MNKNIKKLVVMALAGLTLCGTAMAAPHGHRPPPPPAPMHHRAPAPVHHVHHHHGPGLVTLGATVVGGIVGGIIGAVCR